MPETDMTSKSQTEEFPIPKSKKIVGKSVQTENIIVSDKIINSALKKMESTGDGLIGPTINCMLKSRFRILYIRSFEERRVIEFFRNLCVARGFDLFHWDCDRGLLDGHSKEQITPEDSEVKGDPGAILAHIIDHASRQSKTMQKDKNKKKKKKPKNSIYMLLDFHEFLEIPPIQRKLKEFSEIVSVSTIVIVSPSFICPQTLEKEVTLLDFPVPSYNEIKSSLKSMAKEVSLKLPHAAREAKENEEDLVKAVSGLTLSEAEGAYALSVVSERNFHIPRILEEKKQMIRKSGILEYRDPRFKLDDIGGLDTLKDWIKLRRLAFREDARKFGLPSPKGVLLVGIPGCGKSMSCEAFASAYEMPLLRLDFGAIFSAHIGESENNIRQCHQMAEAIAPCILWIDEIEKGIGGVKSSNSTDGGVTNRVFGTMLTWMQDKTAPVFVVCTANDISGIPPEFMRAGRFDEIFFIDLPNEDQRHEIIEKLLQRKNQPVNIFDIDEIVSASNHYTPVEIEKGIDNALFVAYADGKRSLLTDDIVSSLGKFFPLYNSRHEEIQAMQEWALGKGKTGGRAILANSPDKPKTLISDLPRSIDIEL